MPNHHTTKFCHTCERTLPVESFHQRTSRPSGRASACKDCKRNWRKNTEAGLRWKRASQVRWQKRNPHKVRAHLAVGRAVKRGDLVKTNCSACGSDKQVHGHHHLGYDEPYILDVTWLCHPCHQAEHEILAGKVR